MKNISQYIIATALGLVFLKVLVVLLEPKLTFFPHREITQTPKDFEIDYREITFSTEDGETLSAWFLDHSNPLASLMFFHGNGGNLSIGSIDYLVSLHRHRYSVFAFDYRGYGRSSGSPSEEGLYADSRAAAAFFCNHFRREDKPVLYVGHSLGGVAAACAAEAYMPDGLVLQGTFPDKATLLSYYPLLRLLGFFSRYKLSTLDFIRNVKCPVLVIHGEHDRVVPLAAGRRLFEQLEMRKQFYSIKGAGHADLYREDYWKHLSDFVRTLN